MNLDTVGALQGAKILASFETPAAPMTAPGRVLLVDLQHGYHPVVTWWQNANDGGLIYGHYFAADELEKAKADFTSRCKRGL